jgi:hypothetical protein
LSERFERALERRPSHRLFLELAGRSLALEFAGPALTDVLTDYLAGGSAAHDPAALAINIWDSESTDVDPPPPPCHALVSRGFSSELGGQLKLAFSAASSTLQAHGPEVDRAHYWVRSPLAVPSWEVAQPFRTLLGWWAESIGAVLTHAAVVGGPDRAILFAGASGAGKSTSALACLVAGMRLLSDDSALLELEDGHPVAHALYRTAKVDRQQLQSRLPSLKGFGTALAHDRGKAILAFPRQGGALLRKARITAIVTQGLAIDGKSRVLPESKARTLRVLAPSTLLQSAGNGQKALRLLAEIVQRVPCYRLQAGHDLTDLAKRLAELVS